MPSALGDEMNPYLISWANTTLGLAVPVLTVLIGASVALIACYQWKTNREKLRLDLYQRRFEIYLRVLDFHFAIWQQDEPKLDLLHVPFMKAFWESKFLFPEKSGIYDFLDDYNLRTSRVRVYRSQIPPRSDLTPEERAQLIKDEIWIKDCIGILEEKLGPYLNFHSI
jgi:hypothetical protein